MFDELDYDRCINHPYICYGGGGKSPKVQTIQATPPPPPPAEEATMVEFTDEELDKAKQTSKTQGAKSLQIPLGTIGTAGTVGTV